MPGSLRFPAICLDFVRFTSTCYYEFMKLTFETEQETDGRWLAEVPELPGVMAYGHTEVAALAKVEALALRVIADRLEHGEERPMDLHITVAAE
jgi:predicted RNase H-like HicB family nuclease